MLGIKTKAIGILKKYYLYISGRKLTKDLLIKELMIQFDSDDYGHRSDRNRADLGYGWFHYSIIRMIKPKRVLCIGSRYGFI